MPISTLFERAAMTSPHCPIRPPSLSHERELIVQRSTASLENYAQLQTIKQEHDGTVPIRLPLLALP
ncbi:MAG: hypothetical protein AB7V13_24225 [Pseudorhodoplanes sp.]